MTLRKYQFSIDFETKNKVIVTLIIDKILAILNDALENNVITSITHTIKVAD